MHFSLIICTYKRPKQLLALLESVSDQLLYPDEILVIDGSPDQDSRRMLEENHFGNLVYHKVPDQERGLTKQRNFGIRHACATSEILCFLDDDTILEREYFQELISTYQKFPQALAVGGYITNEVKWVSVPEAYTPTVSEFVYDGFRRKDGSRFVTRKKFGLDSDKEPGFAPDFSNGRSVGFLPPSGKVYEVEQIMGGVSSFRKEVFEKLQFSNYFEGYGLYEDADFCFRLMRFGKLYLNTAARLEHHHAPSGRPNQYRYGKMVVRNGWYVWRIRTPKPSLKARFKWNAIVLLLASIRFSNAIFGKKDRMEAFTESMGRFAAYIGLVFSKPKRPKTELSQ